MQLRIVWIVITFGIYLLFEKKSEGTREETPKVKKKKKKSEEKTPELPKTDPQLPVVNQPEVKKVSFSNYPPGEVIGADYTSLNAVLVCVFTTQPFNHMAAFALLDKSLGKPQWMGIHEKTWLAGISARLEATQRSGDPIAIINEFVASGYAKLGKVSPETSRPTYSPTLLLLEALIKREEHFIVAEAVEETT